MEVEGLTVDPHQFLGLEINPRAAAIAEMVLWIGYLQWHFRTQGSGLPPSPILRDFKNIECRDAVLTYDAREPVTDEHGQPVTRWDGVTMKPHQVTGEAVPDETAQLPLWRYVNPRKASWPTADYIVGNPPFIGNKRMRDAFGDGYVEALRNAWQDVPDTADYVMYWWDHAAATGPRRPGATLWPDHDQQPAPDIQPPSDGAPPGCQSHRSCFASPSPTIRGWTQPVVRMSALP